MLQEIAIMIDVVGCELVFLPSLAKPRAANESMIIVIITTPPKRELSRYLDEIVKHVNLFNKPLRNFGAWFIGEVICRIVIR
jgi:hypothetical protein